MTDRKADNEQNNGTQIGTGTNIGVHTIEILRDELIAAPIEIVFESVLEQLGPYNEKMDGIAMPMKLEAWPGGRWLRELEDENGHFWGNVQAIKRPTLLEISGPLFMSYPAVNNVQYRLSEEGDKTRLKFSHRGFGQITTEHREGVGKGWGYIFDKVRERSEKGPNRIQK